MLEDKDIKKLKEILATKEDLKDFATKDDLKNFATKDDLKNFATKDDLKNFATKDDLKNFATKDDLKNFATKDDLKNFATKNDFKDLKLDLISAMENVFPTDIKIDKRFDKVEENFSDLQTSVDAYSKEANTYFQEMVMLNNKVNRMEKWMHEIAEKVGVELKY